MSGDIAFPFDDPAWDAATDAFLNTDTRDLVQELTERWSEETADYLLFSALLHQGTTYSATFLALPHLVALTGVVPPEHRRTLTIFLGGVALHGRLPATSAGVSLAPAEPWAATPTGRRAAEAFYSLMPEIARLCALSYAEEPTPWQASGLAAALGDAALAYWLESGDAGPTCPACHGDLDAVATAAPQPAPEVTRIRDRLHAIDSETERLLAAYQPMAACPHCGWSSPHPLHLV